jgi:hypothetical protein
MKPDHGGRIVGSNLPRPQKSQEFDSKETAMNRRYCLFLLAALWMPALTTAQSVFNGTWKADLSSAKFPQKPDEYLLKDGTYDCKTCLPPIQVKADGQDQKVAGLRITTQSASRL